MNYKEIKIKVRHEDADIASYVFIENGSEGVSVIDANDVLEILNSKTSWDYYDKSLEILDTEQAVISGGFAEDFDESFLNSKSSLYIFSPFYSYRYIRLPYTYQF